MFFLTFKCYNMKQSEQKQSTARRSFLGAVAAGAAAIGLAAIPGAARAGSYLADDITEKGDPSPDEWFLMRHNRMKFFPLPGQKYSC
jgi:hypothetical protein